MPDAVEKQILSVLQGLALTSEEGELCDFTLEEQNAALESQGITPRLDPNMPLIIGDTVMVIVAAVIFNDSGDVLMIQEAKETCAGKWYLPAGRLNRGEHICEATEREVLEETGYKVECTSLIMVECSKGTWIRFVLTAKIVGGNIKTPAQADQESIQAKWIGNLSELTLRAKDVTLLIDRGREYMEARTKKDKSWHPDILPHSRPHKKLLLRLVVAIKKRANYKVHVLLSERNSWHLPVCEIHPGKSLHSTLRRFMIEIFGADVAAHRPHGILSVEFDSKNDNDGLCLTMLVAFKAPLEEVPIIGKCVWHETTKQLGDLLTVRIASRNSTFPLNVIN